MIIAKQYDVPIKETIFWTIILLSINFICESLSLTLFKNLFSSTIYYSNTIFIIITTSFTTIIGILIFSGIKFLFLKKDNLFQSINISALVALISIPVISIIVLLGFLLSEINININSQIIEFSVASGILCMNIGVLYLYNSLNKHLRKINHISIQKKALESEIKYIEEVKKNQINIKAIKHDLKNQYLVLLGLLDRKATEEAKDYLMSSIEGLNQQSNFHTNDSVLNYLLNEKISIAKKEKIDFKVKIFLSEKVSIDNDILVIIIGNLVDNALEACFRIKKSEDKEILLVIKQFNKNLLIDISNTFDPLETKSRRNRQYEGIGVRSINALVNKNGGLYKHWIENKKYFVSIVLFDIY
ncbi:GHKL domain-containing protein [Lysinibacillus xylanilyticus]|uniref:sensor histidine kinase n=1 Tax=Lysinibacillus xylanilyticus TaxID=582475 RepID=UPI002B24E11B|nr:GHKL domain-containing protein [Lysinibacillus xylanilyticus]MEB2300362.1 GHKL domain-containing protein [Lysinibacillus xylanilyticus]